MAANWDVAFSKTRGASNGLRHLRISSKKTPWISSHTDQIYSIDLFLLTERCLRALAKVNCGNGKRKRNYS